MCLLEIFTLIQYVQSLIACGVPKTDRHTATTACVSLPTVGSL